MTLRLHLIRLARRVRDAVLARANVTSRAIADDNGGGDPHFELDEVAEQATRAELDTWDIPIAYASEDRGLVALAPSPRYILIIDPIDGTRPAMAGFESCCFSVVVVPASPHPRLAQVSHALVMELGSGEYFYAGEDVDGVECSRPGQPRLSCNTALDRMFWSIELTAHPVRRLMDVYGHLVDDSVTAGAVFVFTSATYSLTRLVTGQLDAHVDVGHRILRDLSGSEAEFRRVGRGKVVTLFPYDIAAAAVIADRAGAVVTDAYGRRLDGLALLTDKGVDGQCSLVAAATSTLHGRLIRALRWPGAAEASGES